MSYYYSRHKMPNENKSEPVMTRHLKQSIILLLFLYPLTLAADLSVENAFKAAKPAFKG